MECTLIVRSRNSIKQWDVDAWTALATIAALSAEPETEDELVQAATRYGIEHRLKYKGRRLEAIPNPHGEHAWCFIDLVGHTIVANRELELPDHISILEKDETDPPGGSSEIYITLPRDWIMERAASGWREKAELRHAALAERERIPVRDILCGPLMLEYLSHAMVLRAREGLPQTDDKQLEATRAIHAAWLMGERPELGGRTPRECLLERHDFLDLELEYRTRQWSREYKAPTPLAVDSAAYRYAGFGTVGVVMYFDMVRAIMAEGWKYLCGHADATSESLLTHLEQFQRQWLDVPNVETSPFTPAKYLESDRQRMPVVMGNEMIDCDCPICQAQADGVFGMGPAFMMFDGHHLELEDEFAFSMAESYDEWLSRRDIFRPDNTDIDTSEEDEDQPAESQSDSSLQSQLLQVGAISGVSRRDGALPDESSVWKQTYVDWDGPPLFADPFQQGVINVAFCLSEIVSDLKRVKGGRRHLERLNNKYREFRRSRSPNLVLQYGQELCHELEATAQQYEELVTKCADLQSHIHEILRSLNSEQLGES